MHMRNVPSFLPTNNIGAEYGDVLGRIIPFESRSPTCRFTSSSSNGLNLYIGRETGCAPGTRGIVWSTGRIGGSPGMSPKTSAYLCRRASTSRSFTVDCAVVAFDCTRGLTSNRW
ncbi:hypothetical protein VaNZ11_016809, partial [Volvox africanus]